MALETKQAIKIKQGLVLTCPKCLTKNYLDPYPFWNFNGKTKCAGCDVIYVMQFANGQLVEGPAEAERDPMQMTAQMITPCLWFDTQAEEAAKFYASVFKNSKIGRISRYGKEGYEIHGKEPGSVMTAEFEIAGQRFVALNGGPHFKFNEAISFQVHCETQEEIDYFWSKLTEGGQEGPCGWLKDRYGVSWQVVPTVLSEMLRDPDPAKSQRVTKAFLRMKKFDVEELARAYKGQE